MLRILPAAFLTLAACQGASADQNSINAGGISIEVPPMLHQVQTADGFYFAAGGWRLAWAQKDAGPGTPLLAVQGFSGSGDGRLFEGGLRIGESRDPASVADCASFGLADGNPKALPDRDISGVTFKAVQNKDAGMSQQLETISYRAVHSGRCIAIDRYGYASPREIPEGAPNREDIEHALDQAFGSIQIR